LSIAGDTLGLVLRDSKVQILILNGRSVVNQFQRISGVCLARRRMPSWSLPRQVKPDVIGFAYRGVVRSLSGVELGRDVLVLGYNHNLQSSFGVTTKVVYAIRRWLRRTVSEVMQ
jgi:hypothetical protein